MAISVLFSCLPWTGRDTNIVVDPRGVGLAAALGEKVVGFGDFFPET